MKVEELDLEEEELLVDSPDLDNDGDKPWIELSENDENDEPDPKEEVDDTLLDAFLKGKGINPTSVKFKNDDGEIEEKNFNDLSREEQLEILNYDDSSDNYGLDDEEISIINELRSYNLNAEEYKNYIGQQAIRSYLEQNNVEQSYQIDNYTDDELFIADLKSKIPELTDEEALNELEIAKQNENLYSKKVNSIRNDLKQKEDSINQQNQEDLKLQAEKEAAEYEKIITDTLQRNDSIDIGDSSLKMSEDDMNEVASFILDSDAAGVRYIAKALNDPKTLVEMAWYALKGKEAFSQISSYYKQKITESAKTNYSKGYEDAVKGIKPKKTVVTKPSNTTNKKIVSIDDLD